jgi:molecular chaperone DnaK (HSP70)
MRSVRHNQLTLRQSSTGDTIHVMPDRYGNFAIPSVVSFTETGEALVGQDALDILFLHPERSVTGFKRLLGRSYHEVGDFVHEAHYKIVERNETPAIEIATGSESKFYDPIDIAALVIQRLKTMADEFIGEETKETILTVPAIFNDRQRVCSL